MLRVLQFFFLIYALSATSISHHLEPIPITIYYESLCVDSLNFIVNKLVPTYSQSNYDFASLLSKITLVPYGNVEVIDADKYQYKCQHGPPECKGNKLHGCAVKYFTDKRELLVYIACLMKNSFTISKRPQFPVYECQDKIPKKISLKLEHCYYTNEGWDLFNRNGYLSDMAYKRYTVFIPFITFHNVSDEYISKSASENFRNTLCSQYGLRDPACNDYYRI